MKSIFKNRALNTFGLARLESVERWCEGAPSRILSDRTGSLETAASEWNLLNLEPPTKSFRAARSRQFSSCRDIIDFDWVWKRIRRTSHRLKSAGVNKNALQKRDVSLHHQLHKAIRNTVSKGLSLHLFSLLDLYHGCCHRSFFLYDFLFRRHYRLLRFLHHLFRYRRIQC